MRMHLVPVMFVAIVAASGPAWASQVTGEIKSVDQSAHELVLTNGEAYAVQSNVDMRDLRAGEKVIITAETRGSRHVAKDVTKAG